MRCYLLTLQIPPRWSVLGLLPPIISQTSPEGQPFWWLWEANSKSGSARGFDARRSVRSDLFATGFSLHQVPRNIRTRSSIQVGRALVNGLHPTAPPQPGQQPKGGVRSYSPMVLYIYKSALNNIGDLLGRIRLSTRRAVGCPACHPVTRGGGARRARSSSARRGAGARPGRRPCARARPSRRPSPRVA